MPKKRIPISEHCDTYWVPDWKHSNPILGASERERETQTKLINGWSMICIYRVTYLLANLGWVGLGLGLRGGARMEGHSKSQ